MWRLFKWQNVFGRRSWDWKTVWYQDTLRMVKNKWAFCKGSTPFATQSTHVLKYPSERLTHTSFCCRHSEIQFHSRETESQQLQPLEQDHTGVQSSISIHSRCVHVIKGSLINLHALLDSATVDKLILPGSQTHCESLNGNDGMNDGKSTEPRLRRWSVLSFSRNVGLWSQALLPCGV